MVNDTFDEIPSISPCRFMVLNTRYACKIKSEIFKRFKCGHHYFEIMFQRGIFVWKIPHVEVWKKGYEKNYAVICLAVLTKNREQNRWDPDGHK